MTMAEWAAYYDQPPESRPRVYNVISLEFSKTPLNSVVSIPGPVREIDWMAHWPEAAADEAPAVSKYCLMSVADSYTDFHVDFGGTSVWYHVLRGQKVWAGAAGLA